MKPVNFIIYIIHKGLLSLIISKFELEDIERRCLNGVSIILSLWFMVFSGAIVMFLVSRHIIRFDKLWLGVSSGHLLSIFIVASMVAIFIFVNKKYEHQYYQIINKQDAKYNFSGPQQIGIFSLMFFIPFLMASLGLIFLRKFLYGL